MKILAVEFSSDQRSVAILNGSDVLGRAEETGGRTARAFGLIERALSEAKFEREAIECIAVGIGPGSYAGIRASIALAQGWQLARGIRLVGISSVEGLAAQALAAGITGPITIAIDAQRNEFYCASYELTSQECTLTSPLRLVSLDEALAHATRSQMIVWPNLQQRFPPGRVLLPDAAMLGQLAATRTDFINGAALEPIYLRETTFVKAPPPRNIPAL